MSQVDAEWIRAAVRRHEGPLVLYATGLLGDADRARDVVQDAFLRLCEEDREELEPHLVEWLFAVARNRALDVMRKEGRMSPLTEIDAQRRDGRVPDPARGLEDAEEHSRVLRTLATLPERQREALRLKFQHGLSYKQIGSVLDTSVGNVGYLIHVGLRSLRERLGQEKLEGSAS